MVYSIAASLEDLHGTSLHLRADLQGAKQCYENSLAIRPLPHGFETALKLASIFVEIGTTEEVRVMWMCLWRDFFFVNIVITTVADFIVRARACMTLSSPLFLLRVMSLRNNLRQHGCVFTVSRSGLQGKLSPHI